MLGAAVMLSVRCDMSALRYLALMSLPNFQRPAASSPLGFTANIIHRCD